MRKILVLVEVLLLVTLCCGAHAQQPPIAGATSKPLGDSDVDETPPGGCLPIGVTSSGEVVFPFLCKGFLDRSKGAAAITMTPAEQEKPSPEPAASFKEPEEKTATKKSDESGPETSQPSPSASETVSSVNPPQKRSSTESNRTTPYRKIRLSNSAGCAGYRTFDPASETYRDFSGRRRACRF
jgi:hypothetical protein